MGENWFGFWRDYSAQSFPRRCFLNGPPETARHRGCHFFPCWVADGAFFTLAIAFQPQDNQVFPRLLALAGIPAIAAFATFLVMMGHASKSKEQPLEPLEQTRPRVWKMAILEWSIFVTIVFWFLMAGAGNLNDCFPSGCYT